MHIIRLCSVIERAGWAAIVDDETQRTAGMDFYVGRKKISGDFK